MRMLIALCAAVFATASVHAATITVPMDQQINLGTATTDQSPSGNAIYIPNFGPGGIPSGTLSFETDGTDGWARATFPGNQNPDPAVRQGWYYMYLDLNLAGVGELDLSSPGCTVSFDARYFQDPQTNTNAYGDAPIFARIYTYADDGVTYVGHRDYGIVYATQSGDPRYPEWTNVTIDVGANFSETEFFDPTQVSRIRWYGTDWAGAGNDFVDIRNVTFACPDVIPEPGSMALLATGLLPLLGLRRRKA